jgi:RHS repeat-associated protein
VWIIRAVLALLGALAALLLIGRRPPALPPPSPPAPPPTPPVPPPTGNTPPELLGLTLRNPGPTDVAVFHYRLVDRDADLVELDVRYSLDGGVTFRLAAETPVGGSHGTRNLTSSPTGEPHVFAWDAASDLGPGTHANVIVEFVPRDARPGTAVRTAAFTIGVSNQRPSLHITQPAAGRHVPPIRVAYALVDLDSDPIAIDVAFSLDGGATFQPAQEAATGSDGTTGLRSSPAGQPHVFVWDALADLGAAGASGVVLSVTPRDQAAGVAMRTAPFDVVSTAPPPAPSPPPAPPYPAPHPNPGPPRLRVFQPHPGRGPVTIATLVASDTNTPVDLDLEFSTDGGTLWRRCSLHAESDVASALPASSHWLDYTHIWNAPADLGPNVQASALVRGTVRAGSVVGAIVRTQPLAVDTRPEDPLPDNHPRPVMPISPAIESGDGQKGIAGWLLPQPLRVRVRDRANQPLAGARVTFAVLNPSTTMNAAIEDDPRVSTTTGADGIAGARVRPKAGVEGALVVGATVDGVPGAPLAFRLTVNRPRVVVDARTLPASLEYGRADELIVHVDGDGDLLTQDYLAEDERPRRLRVEAVNAHVSHRELPISAAGSRLLITPTARAGTAEVRVYDPSDPFVVEWRGTLAITTAPAPERLTSWWPRARTPVPVRLEVVDGLDPTTRAEQRVYPGLTLATPFRVKLVDDQLQYTERVTTGISGCVAPSVERLEVLWLARGGRISTGNTAPGSDVALSVPIDRPVYLTATDAGPWSLEARVAAHVRDPLAHTFTWVDSLGHQHCERENTLYVSARFTFLVQPPERFELRRRNTAARAQELRPGDHVVVVAEPLSPYALAGNATPVTVRSTRADGQRPPAWGGMPAPWQQDVPMNPAGPARLESAPLLLIAGNPLPTPTTAAQHQVLPRGSVRCEADGLATGAPVHGRTLARRVVGTRGSVQETVVGTSPTAGLDGCCVVPSGEVVRYTTDLTWETRPGNAVVARAYRSVLAGSGAFGPGWHALFEAQLDLGTSWGYRLLDTFGRVHDFVGGVTPRGVFDELLFHPDVGPDHGIAYLFGPQRDEVHFNVDGSLRLIRDRRGNVTRFDYDSRAHLVKITDPLRREVLIAYYDESDPVPDEVRGRVKRITDFAQRTVDYTYYTDPADPGGRVGLLKQVARAAAPTLVGGQLVGDHRRGETYRYHRTADVRDQSLQAVLDSDRTVLLELEYDAARRVERQRDAAGTHELAYPADGEVVVQDRDGNRRTYRFAASPFPPAATPREIVSHANRGVRPGGADLTTQYEHNDDGHLVRLVHADRAEERFVFEDDAPSVRRRSNLLVHRRIAPSGEQRIASWTYSQRFNLPLSHVSPEGHAAGVSRHDRTTRFTYDHQLSRGDAGNLVRVVKPRQLHGVVVANAAGRDEQRWVHDNASIEFDYNGHGLVTRARDEHGVVTTYAYYPESSPQGGAGVAASPDNGGFLAFAVRDAERTTDRDIYFPGQPLAQLRTQATYHPAGDLASLTDHRGVSHRYAVNALRQLERYEAGAAGAVEQAVEEFVYGPSGLLAQRRLLQPGAPAEAGGDRIVSESVRDALGRIREERADLGGGYQAVMRYDLTGAGTLKRLTTPNAAGGTSPREVADVVEDEHHVPYRVSVGDTQPVVFETEVAPSGALAALVGPGGRTAAVLDAFGAVRGSGDATRGTTRTADDRAGGPVGVTHAIPGTGGRVMSFAEVRRRADGFATRYHTGLLLPHPLAAGGTTYPIAERREGYPGLTDRQPPVARTLLADTGVLSPGDGKRLYDVLRDAVGRPCRILGDDNYRLWFRRDPFGRVVAAGDGALDLRLEHDARGDLRDVTVIQESTDPAAPMRLTLTNRFESDGYGRPVRILDGLGNATRYDYHQREHAVVVTDAAGLDSTERLGTHVVNAPGNERRIETDARGSVRKVTASLTENGLGGGPAEQNPFNPGASAGFGFSLNHGRNVTGVMDSLGNVMYAYAYDERGRLATVVHPVSRAAPNGATTRFTYDAADRVDTVTDPNGTCVKLSYDAHGRTATLEVEQRGAGVAAGGADELHFGYDERDRLMSAQPTGGSPHAEFRFDSDDNVRIEVQTWGRVESEFDGPGLRTSVRYPSGRAVVYHRDWERRIRLIQLDGNRLAEVQYVGTRAIRARQWGPLAMKLTYDDGGRLQKLEVTGFAGGDRLTFDMPLDRLSRFTAWTRTFGTVVEQREWDRDSLGRIRRETATFGGGRQPERVSTRRWFDADSVLRKIDVDETHTGSVNRREIRFDREERGRIVQRDTVMFVYDANGNLRRDHLLEYEYDWLDRLVRVRHPASGQTSEHVHDALGRRSRTTLEDGTEERFVYDGWQLIEVRVAGEPRERYYWGPGTDELLACEIDGALYYAVLAPDGSVDSLVDAQGTVVQTYDYDLFGRRTVLDAARRVRGGEPRCRIGWHGKVHDDRNDLIDFRFRWYNARLGQFLSPDPIGMVPDGNAYAYAGHDPITLSDPWGLGEEGIDWWAAATSFATTVAVGAVVVAGAAFVIGAGIVSAPVVIVGGLAVLAATAVAHGVDRWSEGQSGGEALVGGTLDTVGISQIAHGGWQYDIATGRTLQMSGQQRGQALGGGFGMLAVLLGGGRLFRGFHARGVKFHEARAQAGSFVVKASGRPRDVVWHERPTYVGRERYTSFLDRTTPAGRPHTLEDAMDALTARLHSYPRPGVPFRESMVMRFSSIGPGGRVRGSDLVLMTRHGAGDVSGIANEHVDPLIGWLNARQLARYPQVRLAQNMHVHPASDLSARATGRFTRPGFSGPPEGPPLMAGDPIPALDPIYLGQDAMLLELLMNHGPWAGRHGPGLSPFVVRIAENGAIEEFAYIVPEPLGPRLPLLYHIPDPVQARLPSLLLPNLPPFP